VAGYHLASINVVQACFLTYKEVWGHICMPLFASPEKFLNSMSQYQNAAIIFMKLSCKKYALLGF